MGAQEVQDELRLRNTDFGEVEQCDYRGAAVSTEMVVVQGRARVVILRTQAGAGGGMSTADGQGAPRPTAGTPSYHAVGALVADDPARALLWNGATGELAFVQDERSGARLEQQGVLERLDFYAEQDGGFRVSNDSLHGGCVLLRGSAAGLRAANEGILALERELIRRARRDRIGVAVGNKARGRAPPPGPSVQARSRPTCGWTIGDYDVEVAQEARIADPSHVVVTAGIFANAEVFLNPDGSYRLHADLTVSAAHEGIRTSTSRAGGTPLVQTVPIEKRVAPIRVDLAPGRPRTVDLGTNPFAAGEDGRLVAVVTVQPQ
jgi:hypothetical protein